jgi:peptidoglycan/xylan/chitin deacetylase (PgdA/CDA1 family)
MLAARNRAAESAVMSEHPAPLHERRKALATLSVVVALCAVVLLTGRITAPAPLRTAPASAAGGTVDQRPHPLRARTGPPDDAAQRTVPVAPPPGRCVTVPILVYHYIRVPLRSGLAFELSVTPEQFQAQMDWLRIAGGSPVTLEQVMAALRGGPPLPPHAVVLTFDDGYADFATAAFPVLQREQFTATSFVVSGFVGRPGYMSAAQVQEVAADGIVIGAHTVHHIDLAAASRQVDTAEIDASKAALQQLLGKTIADFAYPYGDVNASVVSLVREAGFADAVTMQAGDESCAGAPFLLPRIRVIGSDSVATFAYSARLPAPPPHWVDPGMPLTGPPGTRDR